MKTLITTILLIYYFSSFAQNNLPSKNYTIVRFRDHTCDIVMKGKPDKGKIKQAIKELCRKHNDDKICVAVWKSAEYFRKTESDGVCIALYRPEIDNNPQSKYYHKWRYWLTFPDSLLNNETTENISALRY